MTGHIERQRAIARSTGVPLPGAVSGLHRFATWRRSMLVGGGAFAALGLLVSVYMAMRLLGLGPVGTLVAAGVLDERARIILADFADRSGDSSLVAAVTEAFRVDFAQSPTVKLMDPSAIAVVLGRMDRDPGLPLGPALAREVAIREGVQAVMSGEINAAGGGFVLSARLVSAETGEEFLGLRESASDSAAIIDAIDRLSKGVRERIGESLKTIRRNEPLSRVTTASLEALRRYSQAVRALDVEGDDAKGVALLEEAITFDTAFAMAYRKLSVALSNPPSQERERSVEALKRAFEHRDRLTDRERYLTLGTYYYDMGERERAITAYNTLLDTYPDDTWALHNLAVLYDGLRDYERAEALYRRAIEFDSSSVITYANLIDTQVALGKFDAAQSTHDRFAEIAPTHPWVRLTSASLAMARDGDVERATIETRALRDAHRGSLQWRAGTSSAFAALAALRGKVADAERHSLDALAAQEARGLAAEYLEGVIDLAWIDVFLRNAVGRGLERVDVALERYPLTPLAPLDRPYLELAEFYAWAGRPDRARDLVNQYESTTDRELRRSDEDVLQRALGAIALAEDHPRAAISHFRQWFEADNICPACALPALAYAHDAAGDGDSTIALYERYLATPGLWKWWFGDWFELPTTYIRLGELYEERGERHRAMDYYSRFVELWKDADAELQPLLQEVRGRVARLVEER
jgi:tetratricopeptide (TPR) repeat protein